jgi:hypothetical protein
MELEESLGRLETGVAALKRLAEERHGAYRAGFLKGLCLALCLVQGRNLFDPADADLKRVREGQGPLEKAGQLDLFRQD